MRCERLTLVSSLGGHPQPVFASLAWLLAAYYQAWPSYGLAIAALTATVFIALLPLSLRQARAAAQLQRLRPQLRALEGQHRGDRQRLTQETLALYRSHRVNPAGGCLPSLVQLPVMIVMYRVIRGLTYRDPTTGALSPRYLDHHSALYRSIHDHGGRMVSWGIDLSTSALAPHGSLRAALPFFALGGLVVATSTWHQHLTLKGQATRCQGDPGPRTSVVRVLPLCTGVFALALPAGVTVYYLVANLLRIAQQHLFRWLHDDGRALDHPAPAP